MFLLSRIFSSVVNILSAVYAVKCNVFTTASEPTCRCTFSATPVCVRSLQWPYHRVSLGIYTGNDAIKASYFLLGSHLGWVSFIMMDSHESSLCITRLLCGESPCQTDTPHMVIDVMLWCSRHWNGNVVLRKFSSLTAQEVVILTNSCAVSITCRLWVIYLCEGRYIGYDYTAYMDYMDPDVLCPQKGR